MVKQGNEDFTQHDSKEVQDIEKCTTRRRIPIGKFLKLKKINFLVYTYLQQISHWNSTLQENHRYIPFSEINKSKLARELDMSWNTVTKALSNLMKEGLLEIKKTSSATYYILPNVGDYYVLYDYTIRELRAMFKHFSDALIRTLLFHKSYSITAKKNGQQEYSVPLPVILETIGYSPTSKDTIIDCNEALKGVGILQIRKEVYYDDDGRQCMRNYYTYTGK